MITIVDMKNAKSEQEVLSTSFDSKNEHLERERNRIEEETKAFLARGGKITSIPTGHSSYDRSVEKPQNQDDNRARLKETIFKNKDSLGRKKGAWHSEPIDCKNHDKAGKEG